MMLPTSKRSLAMTTFGQCAADAGLAPSELIVGVTPSRKHEALLSSYLLSLHRGPVAVREMIVSDLRRFLELGARNYAADLLVVLRLFLSQQPEARRASPLIKEAEIIPFVFGGHCRDGLTARSKEFGDRGLNKLIKRASIAQRHMQRNSGGRL